MTLSVLQIIIVGNMKIAIVCDWLVTIGGAEKFLGELLSCFPDADLFAVINFLEPTHAVFLKNKKITTTFIQQLPFAQKKYRFYLPLMPLAIEQLNLSNYDLIISSSHAVAKGIITGPDQIHICYIHTPMRYAWDLQHQYLEQTGLTKKWRGFLARYFLYKLRLWDVLSANRVDYFIANSKYIARRVQKIYKREATVIYPAINLDFFKPGTYKEDFYLTASRFVPYKRIDLIVESFKFLAHKKLLVIGEGPDFAKIKAKASSNVCFLGYQSNEQLLAYMQQAKAFIFAAEEDFGLVPLEAQACGTPVIAYGKGGSLETVCGLDHPTPTGIFFNEQSTEALINALQYFEGNSHLFTVQNCVTQAAKFSSSNFRKALVDFVNDKCDINLCAIGTGPQLS